MKAVIPLLLVSLVYSCHQPETPPQTTFTKKDSLPVANTPVSPDEVAGNFNEESRIFFDSTEIGRFLTRYPAFQPFKNDYTRFYRGRNYSYAWHDNSGIIEQSGILYNYINGMRDHGIPADIPYADDYTRMMEDPGYDSLTVRELMITGQYLNYARRVLKGIPESDTRSIEWFIPRKQLNFADLLDSLLSGNIKEAKKLVYPQYFLLREKLKQLHDIQEKGLWISIRADRSKYQPGDSSPVVAQIRKKLFLAGDIPGDNGSPVYDSVLKNGIMEFQRRFGLKQDGIAGKTVLQEMSAPPDKRIEQVVVNMERCRWLPKEEDGEYLAVNIPQYKLLVFRNDSLQWTSDVVVGKTTNKTVIFKGDMKYVVFSPYWNVPQSIIDKEIKPAMRRNGNYLASHNMEWNGGKVRQKPGPNNSLGLVKFLFPNSYNIYLHDTPSKSLFGEDKRAFSHGCIRVSEPRKLARYLLRDDPAWSDQKIDAAMHSGKEQFVTLKKTVPVYIVYFTAFVDDRGKLNFREDIYNRDNRLKDMIFEKKPATPKQ